MKERKIILIIQARNDSKRFPKKVLAKINGKPLLWHIIERSKQIKHDKIVVATTKRKIDNEIINVAKKCKVDYFRGSKNNVLDRFYLAAVKFEADIIIRITADCPLIDPGISNKIIKKFLEGNLDYVATDEKTFPKGTDTECFSFDSLKRAHNEAKLKSEHEHVTPYIWKNTQKFKIHILINKRKEPYRLVVDYKNDLILIKKIYAELYKNNRIFSIEDVIKVLKRRPDLIKINQNHDPYEGYVISLKKD
jgi:spore coat polysaccharide biosynthesis protein SpsF (cytidylyltransferase family)